MRRWSAMVICFTLLALAAACGGSSASAVEIVAKAPNATISASTAKVAMTLVIAGGDVPNVTTNGSGVVDFDRKATAMTLDLSNMLKGAGVRPGDASVTMLSQGTTLYMKSPLFSQGGGITAGKWLKLDLAALSKVQGLDLSQLQQAGNNDPRQGLALLEGVADKGAEKIGGEQVRGVDTTHYRVTIDLEKALTRSSAVIDPKAFRQFVDALDTKTLDVDVWIDGNNRVRRVRTPLPVPQAKDAQITVTMEYFGFGTKVDVAPPPASDVVDYQRLVGGG